MLSSIEAALSPALPPLASLCLLNGRLCCPDHPGCPRLCGRPATFFVLKKDTDCELARKFYEENSEVGLCGSMQECAVHSSLYSTTTIQHAPARPTTSAPDASPHNLRKVWLQSTASGINRAAFPLPPAAGHPLHHACAAHGALPRRA